MLVFTARATMLALQALY